MTNKEDEWLTQLPKNWPWEATERDYELYEKGGLKIHLGKTGIPIKKDQLKYLCEIGNKGEGPILALCQQTLMSDFRNSLTDFR